ncbi:MAG TPA: hypothetical protein VGR78_10985, partial [Verrucomicrobiae bacterium]|nr:hypothetical protein [Verrucomicrobiae bacterium]
MPMLFRIQIGLALISLSSILAADVPPLPSDLPVAAPAAPTPSVPVPAAPNTIRSPRISVGSPATTFPGFSNHLQSIANFRPNTYPQTQLATLGDDVISWDAISKEYA